jgi:hypothetical protein
VRLDVKTPTRRSLGGRRAPGAGLRGVCVESCSAHRSWRRFGRRPHRHDRTVNHAAIAERVLARAPDALTTDRPHELAAELAGRRPLAA